MEPTVAKNANQDAYLAYAMALNSKERKIRDDLLEWLPNPLIDCHVHTTPHDCLVQIEESSLQHMNSTFPTFSLDASQAVSEVLYPGVKVRSLRFPKPSRGINHPRANEFLLTETPLDDRVAIFGLPENLDYTEQTLSHPRATALKMYHMD
jgi:hypothetical protein